MLERPDLSDAKLAAALQQAYGVTVAAIEFLPLGVDANSSVYRVVTADATPYFLKARRGHFAPIAVTLPKFLHDQGIPQIIPPLPTQSGQLWIQLEDFTLILYPYIEGHDGYGPAMSDAHWRELGAALRRIHEVALPSALVAQIPEERYASTWTDKMRHILAQPPDGRPMQDGTAQALAAFLEAQTPRMVDLVVRTEVLAARLRAQPPDFTVCHTDLHARNLLIRPDGRLYLVDWDAPLRAPKERDLMFVGGAQYGPTRTPAEEERLFYAGYGPTEVNPTALAYYRAVRIVEDLAIYCEQIFLSMEGGEDRVRALEFVRVNFQPGGTIDAAYRQK